MYQRNRVFFGKQDRKLLKIQLLGILIPLALGCARNCTTLSKTQYCQSITQGTIMHTRRTLSEGVMATSNVVIEFPQNLKVLQCSHCDAVVMLPGATETDNCYLIFCDSECETEFRRKYNLNDDWEHIAAC